MPSTEEYVNMWKDDKDCFGKGYDPNDSACVGNSSEAPCAFKQECEKYFNQKGPSTQDEAEVKAVEKEEEKSPSSLEKGQKIYTSYEASEEYQIVNEVFNSIPLDYGIDTVGRGFKFTVNDYSLVVLTPEGVKIRLKPNNVTKAGIFFPDKAVKEGNTYFVLLGKYVTSKEGTALLTDILHYYKTAVLGEEDDFEKEPKDSANHPATEIAMDDLTEVAKDIDREIVKDIKNLETNQEEEETDSSSVPEVDFGGLEEEACIEIDEDLPIVTVCVHITGTTNTIKRALDFLGDLGVL